MSDAIRAALDAAAWTVCEAGEGLRCGKLCGHCRRQGGAVVAAFLRQMDPVACGDGFTFASLAAAVERAAKEAGDA
jgi:bacterioferritin-associated ferredoxin